MATLSVVIILAWLTILLPVILVFLGPGQRINVTYTMAATGDSVGGVYFWGEGYTVRQMLYGMILFGILTVSGLVQMAIKDTTGHALRLLPANPGDLCIITLWVTAIATLGFGMGQRKPFSQATKTANRRARQKQTRKQGKNDRTYL